MCVGAWRDSCCAARACTNTRAIALPFLHAHCRTLGAAHNRRNSARDGQAARHAQRALVAIATDSRRAGHRRSCGHDLRRLRDAHSHGSAARRTRAGVSVRADRLVEFSAQVHESSARGGCDSWGDARNIGDHRGHRCAACGRSIARVCNEPAQRSIRWNDLAFGRRRACAIPRRCARVGKSRRASRSVERRTVVH